MPGHLLEDHPVSERTTRRGTDTPVHRPETPAVSTHSSTRGLSRLEGKPRTLLSSRVATRVSWSPLSGLIPHFRSLFLPLRES